MIWESMNAMIVIDLTIIALVIVVGITSVRYGVLRTGQGRITGRVLIVLGILCTGLFYLTDLFTMTALPPLIGPERSMALMTSLHLDYRWIVTVLSLTFISVGFVIVTYHRKQADDEIKRAMIKIGSAEENIISCELRYRSMVEQTPDAVFCFGFDPPMTLTIPVAEQIQLSYDAKLIDCNNAFADSLEGPSRGELIGLRFGDMDSALDNALHEKFFRKFIHNNYRLIDEELVYNSNNGKPRALLVNWTGVVNDGMLQCVWASGKNILERKQAEAELEQRMRFQELVAEISSSLIATRHENHDEEITLALQKITEFLYLDRINLIWFNKDRQMAEVVYYWNEHGRKPWVEISLDNFPWLTPRVLAGEGFQLSSIDELQPHAERDAESVRSLGLKSVAGVPLITGEDVVGLCTFGTISEERDWNEQDVQDIQVLAEILTNVIIRVKSRNSLDAALSELRIARDRLEAENVYLRQEIRSTHGFDELVGESVSLMRCLQKVEQVAATKTTVLVQGETGTGKELIARAIHERSDRNDRALVKINCAALPASLIESELFGHEKGAFTGAQARKRGRFDLADGGTLFLDEIGDFPLELQGKLLRILQEGEFERLGGSETLSVDVRLITATNRLLQDAVDRGEFRADLFYRINTFPINLPALRERKEDISLLAHHFVQKHSALLGKDVSAISAAMMAELNSYSWPGNIRELESVIQQSLISVTGSVLKLTEPLGRRSYSQELVGADATIVSSDLRDVEREHIRITLQKARWVIAGDNGAATMLGMPPSTLRSKMQKLGIQRPGHAA